MKKLIPFLTVALAISLSLASCSGGGYTDKSKESLKNTCTSLEKIVYSEADAGAICDCYVEKLVTDFPKNDSKPEDREKLMTDCAVGYKTTMEQSMDSTVPTDSSTAPADSMTAK